LNVSESFDLNTLLRYLLDEPRGGIEIDTLAAREAAARLTERAHRTIHAGLTASDVRRIWTEAAPTPSARRGPRRNGGAR
jgi:hypothetical protein